MASPKCPVCTDGRDAGCWWCGGPLTDRTFVPVQIPSGQWRVRNSDTGRLHGQAFRYEHEANQRARHLERTYA
jgi:hypothetical protein